MSETLPQPEETPMTSERYNEIYDIRWDWLENQSSQPGETRSSTFLEKVIEDTMEDRFGYDIEDEDRSDLDPKLLEKFMADTGISLSELQRWLKKRDAITEELDRPAKRASKYKDN
ncbi:MAG: hypothetical protein UR31_C0015G0021 [Parcubacteria group bacterium GW2011_GWA2_33_14]|uniref:Uncharacterized protein n=1 Tax=Candidatus Staskawiczbacteria bacterium RIFCSPHIGHO2_02_FULL_33_16 TaxID=1802204 RepID=A0A1G2HZ94_9BACT|nr:MAG: hypothetical protein UR31_C0015G0021 [Parcubacteria group bacterium GW2011_GWA2_33_14]OGZ67128.1 MAG: hypothetical protein A3D34_02540 [Candidatus Staskawiczbacteria bacterium RIFCSPHIGHO2_02_FULL_33_16]OGZ70942.1 MAG: hypothetical protein A2980_02950 [Candidatus Staskawiczbacteria bacterium RIFCSPLOWO2_01_FULL_33_13]